MSTTPEQPEGNEPSAATSALPLKPGPPPAAAPSTAPAPPSLQLSFQIQLKEEEEIHLSVDKVFELSFSDDAAGIALLGEQVKTLFKIIAFDALLAGTNRFVRLKQEAASKERLRIESHLAFPAFPKATHMPSVTIQTAEPQPAPLGSDEPLKPTCT